MTLYLHKSKKRHNKYDKKKDFIINIKDITYYIFHIVEFLDKSLITIFNDDINTL